MVAPIAPEANPPQLSSSLFPGPYHRGDFFATLSHQNLSMEDWKTLFLHVSILEKFLAKPIPTQQQRRSTQQWGRSKEYTENLRQKLWQKNRNDFNPLTIGGFNWVALLERNFGSHSIGWEKTHGFHLHLSSFIHPQIRQRAQSQWNEIGTHNKWNTRKSMRKSSTPWRRHSWRMPWECLPKG